MAKKNRPSALTPNPPTSFLSGFSHWLGWLSLAWLGWIIFLYWQKFAWITRIQAPPTIAAGIADWHVLWLDAKAVFLAITLIIGMSALGSYALRWLRLPWESALEEFVFSAGMGLALAGYLLLGLGLLQWYQTPVFWAMWLGGLVLAWMRWGRGDFSGRINRAAHAFNTWLSAQRSWSIPMILLAFILLLGLVMTFVPEVFYDAMVYHLGVPKWYLFEGGIQYYPAIHSQFPFLRQMLNVLGLALEGERLAKLLHFATAPLMLAAYQSLARRYSSPKAALIAGLAFFSMPMVNMNLWTTGMDVGLALYALLAFAGWLNGVTDTANRRRWFTLAGLFAGFCFATKYPGALVIACMCVVTLVWMAAAEKKLRDGLRESVRIGSIATAAVAPWFLKSWWLAGNPVYPYLAGVLGGRDLEVGRIARFFGDAGQGVMQPLQLLLTPWKTTWSEISTYSSPGVFFLGLLGFFFAALLRKELRTPWYAVACALFLLYWFTINATTGLILRFAIPGLAIGCFLLAHAAGQFYERSSGAFRTGLAGAVSLGSLWGILSLWPTLFYSYAPSNVLAGKESAEAYLSYSHPGLNPSPATRMLLLAKDVVPPGKRVLLVGDEKVSSSPVPFLASGAYNQSLVVKWSKEAKTVSELAEQFRKHRISHMVINVSEAMRLRPYEILDWDADSMKLFDEFSKKHLRLVRVEDIPEVFVKARSALLMYEFFDTPPASPPSPNVLREMHERAS